MFFMIMCTTGWWWRGWSCSSAIGVDDDHVDDDHHRLVVEGVELFQCYWSSVSGLSPRSAEFPVDPQVHLLGEKYLGIVLDKSRKRGSPQFIL